MNFTVLYKLYLENRIEKVLYLYVFVFVCVCVCNRNKCTTFVCVIDGDWKKARKLKQSPLHILEPVDLKVVFSRAMVVKDSRMAKYVFFPKNAVILFLKLVFFLCVSV